MKADPLVFNVLLSIVLTTFWVYMIYVAVKGLQVFANDVHFVLDLVLVVVLILIAYVTAITLPVPIYASAWF